MAWLVAATLLPFALYTGWQAWSDRERSLAVAIAGSEQAAQRTADVLDRHMDRVSTFLAAIEPLVADGLADPPALDRQLSRMVPAIAGFASTLGVFAPDGTMIASGRFGTTARQGLNVVDHSYFQAALNTRAPSISEPFELRPGGEWAVVVARPVLDANAQVRAIVTIATSLEIVDRILESNAPNRSAQMIVASSRGATIARWPSDPATRGDSVRGLRQFRSVGDGQVFRGEVSMPDGTGYFGASVPAHKAPWQIFVAIPAGEAVAGANAQMRNHLMVAAAMLLVSLLAAGMLARGFARPLLRLREKMGEVSLEGVPRRVVAEGGELGALAEDINRMAERLSEAQDRLRSIISLGSDWYWETDADFHFTSIEGSFGGAAPEASRWMLGMHYLACGFVHADPDAQARRLAQRIAYRNEEFSLQDREGRTRHVFLVSGEPRFAGDGTFLGYRGAGRDITESRSLQDSERSARERLRLIIDSVPALIAYVDREERYVFCNRRYSDFVGTKPQDVVGRKVRELIGEAAYEPARSGMRQAMEGAPASVDARFAGASGEVRDYMVQFVPDIDASGRVAGLIAMAVDVTDVRNGQRALAASEHRFRELTELSSDWYWEQDAEFRFTYQSSVPGGAEYREFLGKRRWDVPSINLTEDDWVAHRALLERREPFHDLELLRIDAAGAQHWGAVSGRPTFDMHGGFTGYCGVGRDITARKLVEGALQAESNRLARIIETMAEGLAIIDADGRYLLINTVAAAVFGTSRESIIGTHYADVPFRRMSREGADVEVGGRIFEQIRDGSRLVGPVPMRIDRGDGVARHITLNAARLHDEAGEFAGVVATFVDVTENVLTEARIAESEARFRSLFELSQDGLAIHRDGRIERANPTLARLMGFDRPEKLFGLHVAEIMAPQDREAARERVRSLSQGEHLQLPYAEARLQRADGSTLEVETAGTLLGAPGTGRMSIVVRDLSERKAHEREILSLNADLDRRVQARTAELRAAYRDMEAFSYNVSHDLRAPLRAMNGFTAMLLEDFSADLPKEACRLLERVAKNADRMESLIESLLAFGRLTRQPLALRRVELREVVDDVLEELGSGRGGRRRTITVGSLPDAWADPVLLRQVFSNLLSNAVKYSAQCDRPVIEIGAIEERPGPTYFVRDNGAGFDMAYADKLFGMFQRLHSPSEFEGNGVGLAMVRRIVERHGGEIWAESAPGKGAAFYFRLDGRGIARDPAERPTGKFELREVPRDGVLKPAASG